MGIAVSLLEGKLSNSLLVSKCHAGIFSLHGLMLTSDKQSYVGLWGMLSVSISDLITVVLRIHIPDKMMMHLWK